MATEEFRGHMVVIEWDGMAVPNAYYHRIRNLTSKVRGDKNISPLARRAGSSSEAGIIIQESVVFCTSESLAKFVGQLAVEHGAKMVFTSPVNLTPAESVELTEDDLYAMQRIANVYGRRGKPAKHTNWSVTCFEEISVFEVKNERGVANCPHCGGFEVKIREGTPVMLSIPDGDIYSVWLRTRFSTGTFEVPVVGDYPEPPAEVDLLVDKQRKIADLIRKSDLSFIEAGTDLDGALRRLDALFASKIIHTYEERRRPRVDVFTEIVLRGYSLPSGINIAENEEIPDPLDLGDILGTQEAVHIYEAVLSKKKQGALKEKVW